MDETTKMDPKVKTEWVRELRSGKYPQGEGYLQRGDAYCCLGVLCEVAVKDGIITSAAPYSGGSVYAYADSTTELPPTVADWAGITSEYRFPRRNGLGKNTVQEELVKLNDTDGATFGVIADWVEANL